MSIQDIGQKFKELFSDDTLYYGLLIVLVGGASFGLGRLSVEGGPASPPAGIVQSIEKLPERSSREELLRKYVGSKNSDKYHLPECSGAQRIAEENRIWFASRAEAEAAGYTPAGNCEGI